MANEDQTKQALDDIRENIARNGLHVHKTKYLQQAVRVRDSIGFSRQDGCVSLLDFLNAECECCTVQISYVNPIGSYLTTASQLNFVVGREAIR